MAEAGRRTGWIPGHWPLGSWWLRHGLGPLLLHWWRRRGLRSRVTLTAALGLLIAFAAADLLLFNALRVSLTRSVDDYARSGATEVAALINASRLPDPVPVAAGTITIQVLDTSGRITDVSPDADRLVPIVSPPQAAALARSGAAVLVHGGPFGMPSLLRVSAVRADGGQLVIAAVPFSEASGSLSVVARALVIGTPVLFLAFTAAIWIVTGSTLRPIGALRRGAARVTGTGVPSDLPVPEARDEVRLLALTLNDMLSRLAGAQQRQRALVSDTAHELRSPIASIRTQLEVALDFPDGQDWAATARDVHADVLRLARLAEDLLLLARLDEQAAAARRGRPVDLADLARSVVCRYGDAPVAVTVTLPAAAEEKLVVSGDSERLDRLLVNLVDNAVRYAKSSVVVSVRRDGRWAELAVTDDGPGIPAADRARAFDRFARLDDARSRDGAEAGGAGLGLAIVRATAQAYGGTASLSPAPDSSAAGPSAAGPGLRAVVRLPAGDISFLHASNLGAACRTVSAPRSVTCGARTGPRSCGRST
ncbi:MAG TPA: HAMP domain-containing sensor histidine kinase [Trebonia sp.]|nr:HAMP domain-containing sensor histidine kinase [Trebonia sp.]